MSRSLLEVHCFGDNFLARCDCFNVACIELEIIRDVTDFRFFALLDVRFGYRGEAHYHVVFITGPRNKSIHAAPTAIAGPCEQLIVLPLVQVVVVGLGVLVVKLYFRPTRPGRAALCRVFVINAIQVLVFVGVNGREHP